MKWFQHQTDAHDDEFLKELMHRFGSDGYTAWWVTAELVAKVVKITPTPGVEPGYKVSARLEAAPHVFTDATKIDAGRLQKVYSYCTRRGKLRFRRTRERWVVDWPKVLDFKDNYTSDLIDKYRKFLGRDLEAPSEGVSAPMVYTGKGTEGGAGGVDEKGEAGAFSYQLARRFSGFCHAPGTRSMTGAILDALRQGVPRRLLMEAPMNPQYQKMDFYAIMRDIRAAAGNGHGGMSDGAKQIVQHFGLGAGALDGAVERRIREREEGAGGGGKEGSGAGEAGAGGGGGEAGGKAPA